jgi:hypothetical protein
MVLLACHSLAYSRTSASTDSFSAALQLLAKILTSNLRDHLSHPRVGLLRASGVFLKAVDRMEGLVPSQVEKRGVPDDDISDSYDEV